MAFRFCPRELALLRHTSDTTIVCNNRTILPLKPTSSEQSIDVGFYSLSSLLELFGQSQKRDFAFLPQLAIHFLSNMFIHNIYPKIYPCGQRKWTSMFIKQKINLFVHFFSFCCGQKVKKRTKEKKNTLSLGLAERTVQLLRCCTQLTRNHLRWFTCFVLANSSLSQNDT